ncbi:MAG: hypothetical protein IKN54_04090, partial [Lachnospiraceae bacterium]|nr:hypothetical protein [Lachnospiraceae bacterium]
MKSFIKNIIITFAFFVTLSIATSTDVHAANWESYWGYDSGWFEGAMGELHSVTDTGWVAYYEF